MDLKIWQNSLEQSMLSLWEKVTTYFPNIAGALLIVAIGYFISKVLRKTSEKILTKSKLDNVCDKVGVHEAFAKVGIKNKFSSIVGFLIFWMFMLTFLISAAESLNLAKVTETIDALVMYLPNVLGAALVFVLGLMLAQFVANALEGLSKQIGLEYSKILANLTRGILVVFVTVLAISQLQIETVLLDNVLQILLLSAGAVVALSFGLGTRGLSRNLVSGICAKNQYDTDSTISVNEKSGKLKEIGLVNFILETSEGQRIHIPNSNLVEMEVVEKTKATIPLNPKKQATL